MKFSQIILLGALVSSLFGCEKLSNSISQVALDCGSDADRSASYVKVLDPQGHSLNGSELIGSSESPNDLSFTSRGCVRVAPSMVIAQPERGLGLVLNQDAIPFLRQVKLQDVREKDLGFSCNPEAYLSGGLQNPLLAPDGEGLAFPFETTLTTRSEQWALNSFSLQDTAIFIPLQVPEGPIELRIDYKNLFNGATPRSKSCAYILDRTPPKILSSLSPVTGPDSQIKVRPGEVLSFTIEDAYPEGVRHCLRAQKDADRCSAEAEFESGYSLQAPDQGKWCLKAYAFDKAGNRSETIERCFIAWQDLKIDRIVSSGKLAQSATSDLDAGVYLLEALKDYSEIATDEEKASARDSLISSLAEASSRLFQRNKVKVGGAFQDMKPVGDLWVSVGDLGIQLWTPEARLLDSAE
ncbi:MAG: hypothetical protein EOP10_26580, partial [Proteobacteria bacterium]